MLKRTQEEIMASWKGDVTKPLVSVCTITYNHEKFIAEALDSFLMQETDFPFEIVVDDDCSIDNNAQIIKEYADRFPHIIKANLREKNVGMIANFIANMKRAKGKYIALCEGDDYWTDPLKLQRQVDFLKENDEYVITYSSVEAFNENGTIETYIGGATRDLESIELQKASPINTLTVCFRNVLEEFPPEFQCTKFGDLFLWSLLGAFGKGKFLKAIKPSRYRIHDGGVFSKKTAEKKEKMKRITYLSLYTYYIRMNNVELDNYFLKQNVLLSFHVDGRLFYIKIIASSVLTQIMNLINLINNVRK